MSAPPRAELERIAAEAEAELRVIMQWWADCAADPRGGFHGEVDARNAPLLSAAKGAVLNARILWFFSAASAEVHEARALADRAQGYLLAHFFDRMHGGVFWALDASGAPSKRRKQAYAQAFAIYGLCAHHGATGNEASLEAARGLFDAIETHFVDTAHGGYIEAAAEDWSPIADMRLSAVDANTPKSMNTHLHVLEAYTALYAATPSARTRDALQRCIAIHLDRLMDASGHLRLFFDLDWTDRSEAISFGHDIEASWLIWEACEALGDDALSARARPIVLKLAETALREGVADGGLANERTHAGVVDARRVWWAQAEAMVGFLSAYELSGDAAYFSAFAKAWDFIKAHHRHPRGEWRWFSSLDAPSADRDYKAGFWKCPYHNGRAMMETSKRLRRMLGQKNNKGRAG